MERRSSSGGSSVDPALKNYKLIRNIGHGAFGKVKLARHRLTGLKVAIKILNRRKVSEQNMDEKVNRELMVGKLLVHPHVIRLYEVIETTSDIYVVMEYAERGELFDYIVEHRRLEEDEARKFFQQIISGVEYCHKNRVAHRDLKPENLLLDSNGNVKIADFGLCNIIRDGYFLKTSCGSPNYAAPEVLSGKPYIGPEVDVWSCGVILYVLLCGSLPFDHGSLPVLYSMIRRGVYTLPSHLTTGARDLIARMLAVEPLNRITIPEIRQHYWFQVNLPYYLAAALPEITHQMNKIDEEVLEQVVTLGYNRNFLDQSLQSGIQDDATVTYYLLLDNHRVANNLYNTELDNHMGLDSSSADSVDFSQSVASQHSTHSTEQQGIGFSPQSNSESRWGLGFQLGLHPHHIMVEVLNALRQLNVCWKKTGRYNIKCKWCRDGHVRSVSSSTLLSGLDSGDESSQDTLKFELQLYKTSSEKYLLDLHRLKGPQVLFIDLCTSFLARLQIF